MRLQASGMIVINSLNWSLNGGAAIAFPNEGILSAKVIGDVNVPICAQSLTVNGAVRFHRANEVPGGVYASLALALVLIYRSTGVVNFAQGEMATFSTFIAWSLMHHMSYWPAFLLTCLIAFAGGVALERTVIRPVENAPVLTIVIVTLGLALIFNGGSAWSWGGAIRR